MRIMHPTKSSVGVNGETYDADENGMIDVPDDATILLHPAHGFVIVSEPSIIMADADIQGEASVEAAPKRRRRKVTDDSLHDIA